MRVIHTGDWHLGRLYCGMHLTEDQAYIITKELLPMIIDEKADALVIAGDIYDRAVPVPEAVELFDSVLAWLMEHHVKLFAVAGNHDSGRRIDYGSRIFKEQGIYIRGIYDATDEPIPISDEHGKLYVALFPYMDPASVRDSLTKRGLMPEDEAEVTGFDKTTGFAIANMASKLPAGVRSIAVAHAFVAGSGEKDFYPDESPDSERVLSVGGSPNVSPRHFAPFTYTALGHIHKPQRAGGENIRYSGSLMKYSFDEASQRKGAVLVDIDGNGNVNTETRELHPRHDVRRVKGSLDELMSMPVSDDYIEAHLTDSQRILGAQNKLRKIWPNLASVMWEIDENTVAASDFTGRDIRNKTTKEKFCDFISSVRPSLPLTEDELHVLDETLDEIDRKEREAE